MTNSNEPMGLSVHDIEGTKVGDVVDFYFDVKSNEPQWIVVEAGAVNHKQVLVPLEDASRTHDGLKTPYPKDMIMEAPHVDGPSIGKASEAALYQYYHLRRELPGRSESEPAFEQNRSQTGDGRLRSWKVWKAA